MVVRSVLLTAALFVAAVAAGSNAPVQLPGGFKTQLRNLGIPRSSVSVLVYDLAADKQIWSLNPAIPRNPASAMKTLTTFAALHQLGPGYRWANRAYVMGRPDAEHGVDDLYLLGGGNPFWVAGEFRDFVAAIHSLGVHKIRGDLVLDQSQYAPMADDRSVFDGKRYRVYNVLPHPFTMNFNSVRLQLVPNAAKHSLAVVIDPPVSNIQIDNRIELQRKSCRRGNIALKMAVRENADASARVTLSGRFPERCPSFELTRSVLSDEAQLFGAFSQSWRDLGAEFDGFWRDGAVPEEAILLYEQNSRPLGDLIRSANKFSNNVMTRQIFLTLGAEAFGAPATLEKSRAALLQALADNDLVFDELVVDNGAGLSRDARISAASLMALLQSAWRHRYAMDFFASMPVPGVDGTLASRFERGPFVGQAYIKTGTLDHVSAVAGLVNSPDGGRYLLVMMINHPNVHKGAGRSLQKALLRHLMEGPGRNCCQASN